MVLKIRKIIVGICAVAFLFSITPVAFAADRAQVRGRTMPKRPGVQRQSAKALKSDPILDSGILFTATLDSVATGPTSRSYPPIYNHQLKLTIKEVFRGDLKAGDTITATHQARQHRVPKFPKNKLCLITASKVRGSLNVNYIKEATDELINKAKFAKSMPVGWVLRDQKTLSPWASMGKDFWPKGRKFKYTKPVTCAGYLLFDCSVTSRPVLMAGKKVKFTVKPVPPVKEIKWTNPDGDGLYEVTVTNPTKKDLLVYALLRDGDKILWNESIAMMCDKAKPKVQPAPGCKQVPKTVDQVVLKPGQSVSGQINALGLKGVEWPRGGSRIEFMFALGEKSVKQSFYYKSKHHDKIRDKAQTE
jgi:hypothetical protein